MSFIDFADLKARCSIVQAANLVGLKCTEERLQLRAPCPACTPETAEMLGIAMPVAVDKRVCRRTGEATIGRDRLHRHNRGKTAKAVPPSNVATFPKKTA